MSESEKDKVEVVDEMGESSAEANVDQNGIIEPIVDAVVVEDSDKPSDQTDAPETGTEDAAEPAADVAEAPKPVAAKPRSPIVPMLIGGVVAGAIGFGAATYLNIGSSQTEALAAQLDAQSTQIDALKKDIARVEGLADTTALSAKIDGISAGIETKIANASSSVDQQLARVTASIADLEARLLEVEKRPMADTVSQDAVAAYEAELAALRESITKQRAEVEQMAAEAAAKQQAAREDALRSQGTGWVTDINIALAEGTGFAEPLAALASEGVDIPAALQDAAENGVQSQSDLVASFPEAARAALSAVRSEASDQGGGVLVFLQNQLGARSVAPKQGDSADAVLSRAEAAAKSGDLAQALVELDALPESGKTIMSQWSQQAQDRLNALAALDQLRQSVLNK